MHTLELKEVLVNEMIVFHVLDMSIELFSSETCYGWKTAAEIAGRYHYLEDELINIETAVNLYQYLNNRMLSQEEIQLVMDENIPRLGDE